MNSFGSKSKNDKSNSNNRGYKPFFQPKLTVNQPNDVYEQEADSMADHVMRMTDISQNNTAFFKRSTVNLQRKCQHCEEEEKLHRKETSDDKVEDSNQLDNYVGSLGSSGQSLPNASRQFFESRFGHDFSDVRIHNDSVAAKSAQSVNALAYTSGNNIVFNSGQYSPESESGKRLMAHELTHVVQQGSAKQNGTVQRAPQTTAATNWWDDKSIGTKPEKKFWDDIHLFFPKDARKFSGTSMGNTATIDCDNNDMVIIGKGYWDEADAMKRKLMLPAIIEKADDNRFKASRTDNEDLTNTKITTKLKALTGNALQTYLKSLDARKAYVKNDQVIAYLNADDKGKAQIVKTANDNLLDYKFDNDRLTTNDLKDERINTRLRGLSNSDKLTKEANEKDFSAKTGEDSARLQTFLHTQTTTSTPLPDNATVSSAGGFTMSFNNVDVIVLPDTTMDRGKKGNATFADSNLPKTNFNFHMDSSGLITDFFTTNGKQNVPLNFPGKLKITIQTKFEVMSNADQTSAYGRGTTTQDIQWGGKTLRFHEGSHGKGFIDFISSHSFPSIALGSVKPGDITTIQGLLNQMNIDSCTNVDQVGITQNAFLQTPAGQTSGIISCAP